MSARIKVTEDVVGAALQSVTRSRAAFERAGAVSDAASGAVGYRPLADALDDFADNWRITRTKLTASMRALELNLGKAQEELERWDHESVPTPSQTPPSPPQGTTTPSQGASGGTGGGGGLSGSGSGAAGDSLQQTPVQQSPVQQSPVEDPPPPQKGGVEDPGFDRLAPDPTVGQDPDVVQPVPPDPGTGSTDPDDLPPTPLTPTQPPVTDDAGSSGEPLDSSDTAEEGSDVGIGDAALLGGAGLAGALAGTAGAAMRGAAASGSGGSSGGSAGSLPTGGGAGLPADALGKLDPLTGDDKTNPGSSSRDLPDLAPTVTEDQLPDVGTPAAEDKSVADSSAGGGVKAAAPLLGGAAVAGGGAGGVALHNKFGAGAVEPPEPPRADTDRVKRARESLEELRRKRSEQYHTQDDETEEI